MSNERTRSGTSGEPSPTTANRRPRLGQCTNSRATDQSRRACVAAAVLWLAVCTVALCIAVLGALSVEQENRELRSRVEIENSLVALVAGQAFYLVFIWPLFERRIRTGRPLAALAGTGARLVGLLLLSAPFLALALRTSEAGLADAIRSQCLVLFVGMAAGTAIRLPGALSWYYPAAFTLSGLVPLAAYMLRETGELSAAWAGAVSPLWAAGAAAAGARPVLPFVVFACLAGGAAGAFLAVAQRQANPDEP